MTDATAPGTMSKTAATAPVPADDRIEISRVTRGRMRPHGSRREKTAWYLMRITGLGLFVLALAHFSILHFIYDPAQQNAEFIATQMLDHDRDYGGSHLALGLVLRHKEDTAGAAREMDVAMKCWRDADPDLVELKESRAGAAKR